MSGKCRFGCHKVPIFVHMQIEDLSTIAEATNNEVTLANLGPRFTDAAAELLEQLPQSHGTGT